MAKEQTGKEVGGETACLQVKSQEQVDRQRVKQKIQKGDGDEKKKEEEVKGTYRINSLSRQTGQF